MSPETFDQAVSLVRTLAELAVSSGIAAAVVKYFQAKGLDIKALQNNTLVQAAENVAHAVVMDAVVQGKSLTDPQVLTDAAQALKTSLAASHADTVKAVGASDGDLSRIAANATKKVALSNTDNQALGGGGSAPAPDLSTSLIGAVRTITEAKAALGQVSVTIPATVPGSPPTVV